MPYARVNGVRLYYEREGDGEQALVFLHGGWASHAGWNALSARAVPIR